MSTSSSNLSDHWPEYLMEAACLGLFMISACAFGVLLEHPMSPVHQTFDSSSLRRALGGIAMGLTSIALVCSPWGKRSGAHLNPALTLTYLSLGKIQGKDAFFYVVAQFMGGILGIQVADLLIGLPLRHGAVNYVATTPGTGYTLAAAFGAEFAISMLMMLTVLFVSNNRAISRFTPFVAGTLVALYIWIEAPVSGMSMNPARTFGSAFGAHDWNALWIYFAAPLLGMMAAGQVYARIFGPQAVLCAKLHHHNRARCIFHCNFAE
jgi:aquaporin Z